MKNQLSSNRPSSQKSNLQYNPQNLIKKVESSEDIGRQELEEGKTSSVSDFLIRSPNIQKKRMDFGHGSQNEYVWMCNGRKCIVNEDSNIGIVPTLVESIKKSEIKTHKMLDKWERSFILDKSGKLYEWQTSLENQNQDKENNTPNLIQNLTIREIDQEIEGGKMLSKLGIKDIASTSNCLFMVTENGEVIVGKAECKNEQQQQNESQIAISQQDSEDLFSRKSQKLTQNDCISFSFMKLNSIQSHFIAQVSCGNNHAILLTSSGFVYSFGRNDHGQLGHSSHSQNSDQEMKEPTIIFQLLNLKVFQIACGKNHTLVLGTSRDTMASTFQIYSTENALFTTIDKNKTLVYGWGHNKHGQLGMGDDKNRTTPVLVEHLLDYNFKKISCGYYHSAFLEENGNLFMCGNNEYGQIGVQEVQNQRQPIIVFQTRETDSSHLHNQSNNQLHHQNHFTDPFGEDSNNFNNQRNQSIVFIQDFQCNRYTSLCMTDEYEVYLWGKNILGNFSSVNEQKDIFEQPTLVRIEKDLDSAGHVGNNRYQDQSFGSYIPGRGDQSFQMNSGANSFIRNNNNEGFNTMNHTPYGGGPHTNSTGISFSSEFQNLLQYIAITAGNTKMPDGIKPMTFRPGNLPPKTQEEEKMHQKLVEENRKQYLKKVKEREKLMEKKRQELERKEKKILELKETWETEILPNWDQVKRTKRVRELWIEGLPPVVRGKVWYYAFGNRNSITKELYNIMAEKGNKLRKLLKELQQVDQEIIDNGGQPRKGLASEQREKESNSDEQSPKLALLNQRYDKLRKKLKLLIGKEPSLHSLQGATSGICGRERSISIIETDLPRTFPNLGFFKPGGMHYDQLQRILEAFTVHRCDIGYVQGMSYVAATLLLYMEEHQAFVTFTNMITKYPIMPFYSFNEAQVRKILQLFKQVFAHNLPELCDHLEMENVQPKQYVYEWFMTVFTRALNLSLLSRVWDFYFLDGIFVLYQTSIAILRILEKHLIEQDFEEIMRTMKNVADYVTDEEELVTYIYDVSFPKWVYDEIPKLESEFLKTI